MCGHYANKDLFLPEMNQRLTLQREPENAKDKYEAALIEDKVVLWVIFHWDCLK